MSTHMDMICTELNENFLNKQFKVSDIMGNLPNYIPIQTVRSTIFYAKHQQTITCSGNSTGRVEKIYHLKDIIESEKIKRIMSLSVRKSRGDYDPEMFSDLKHPSKRYISDHFYTTFSVFSNKTKSILALCGPNVERFATNVLKIMHPIEGHISLVECDANIVEIINTRFAELNVQLPKHTMYNIRLEDFLGSGFYQFQELDCEGNWKLLYSTFYNRLIEQAKNKKHIKGMILTTFARRQNVAALQGYLAPLLSNIGVTFNDNVIMDPSVIKKIPGEWHYVHLYDDFPQCTNMGRLRKLVVYRYSQGGNQMFTALIIYK